MGEPGAADIEAIKRRAKHVTLSSTLEDDYIQLWPQDYEALLARVKALQDENERLQAALERALPWLVELAGVVSNQDKAVALDFEAECRSLLGAEEGEG